MYKCLVSSDKEDCEELQKTEEGVCNRNNVKNLPNCFCFVFQSDIVLGSTASIMDKINSFRHASFRTFLLTSMDYSRSSYCILESTSCLRIPRKDWHVSRFKVVRLPWNTFIINELRISQTL